MSKESYYWDDNDGTRRDYDYDRCRINPCLNSIITADSLFSSSFSSPCTSSLFGDSIGMESCVDVLKDVDAASYFDRHRRNSAAPPASGRDRRRRSPGEFPPPIPSLARTENLQPRMPWVLRRRYTGDGRLVLTEEKAPRHEYFRADRSNGRLTLHLVTNDHDHDHGEEVDEDDDDSEDDNADVKDCGGGCGAVEVRNKRLEVSRRGASGGSGGSRCVDVGVGVQAAISPVHS